MKKNNKNNEEIHFYVPIRQLLFTIFNFKRIRVLILTKNKIEYFGILENLDRNMNVYLKQAKISFKGRKIYPKLMIPVKKIILNGNKVNIILPLGTI